MFGTFAALIVVLITKTIALTSSNTVDVSPTGAATLAVISFVVGYRERPSGCSSTASSTPSSARNNHRRGAAFELTPATFDFGTKPVNTVHTLTVALKNVGDSAFKPAAPTMEGAAFSVQTARIGNVAAGQPRQSPSASARRQPAMPPGN